MYLKKPFPHFHSFIIGLVLGCCYYAFKNDKFKKDSKIHACFQSLRDNRTYGIIVFVLGLGI